MYGTYSDHWAVKGLRNYTVYFTINWIYRSEAEVQDKGYRGLKYKSEQKVYQQKQIYNIY